MKVCIVGGVAGGASAAARLRRLNESAEIVMFERGPFISYANCGLPYHLSKTIEKREALLLQTPESFHARFRVDVRVQQEVLGVDPKTQTLTIKRLQTGETYTETYDKLVLSPGAKPFIPPIPGADYLFPLKDIPQMDDIVKQMEAMPTRHATVIGGGFIGCEVAENLVEAGYEVHLVELSSQLMAPFDPDMANILHSEMLSGGVHLHLEDAVTEVSRTSAGFAVKLKSGEEFSTGIVICAIGVQPDTDLAKDAGLEIGKTGGIVVSSQLSTSDPNIYAVGDAIEVRHRVSNSSAHIPLAGPANRQGRTVADQICGIEHEFTGCLGTGIVKIFSLQAASTGLNEKTLKRTNIPYQAIHLHPNNHAGYYPGATSITLKFLFSPDDGRIFGAQAIGVDGADKRIDVLATAIQANLTVFDLQDLELCYAPPFGSAKDPVNLAGMIAANHISGLTRFVTYSQIDPATSPLFVDVRTTQEVSAGKIPGSLCIPVDSLRDRLAEIPKDRNIIVVCGVGLRAHVAARILSQSGYANTQVLSGGFTSYRHELGLNLPTHSRSIAKSCSSSTEAR